MNKDTRYIRYENSGSLSALVTTQSDTRHLLWGWPLNGLPNPPALIDVMA